MATWLPLTFFICLHNQLSSINPLSRIKDCVCLKKIIHQIDSKNGYFFQQVLRQNLGWFMS